MKKRQSPLFPELALDPATGPSAQRPGPPAEFIGTENPRHLRVLQALLLGPRSRKQIDGIAGAANGPQLIASLRERGLTLPCRMVPGIDRDGHAILYGVYALDDADRKKVRRWLRKRQRKTS
jgi:hypothetical protein